MHINSEMQLQQALDKLKPGDELILAPGDYHGKCLLRTSSVTIRGAGMDKTRIIWDDYAEKPDEQGVAFNTFRTWTMAVCADHVTMENLAILNTAGSPEVKGQEVALTVYGDDFHMNRCRLSSTQDTLFAGPLPGDLIERYRNFLPDYLRRDIVCRQVYRDCLIEGTVDFIFGCGEAVFDSCEIRSVHDNRNIGYAAAPAHALTQTDGFLFRACRFTHDAGVNPATIYLARPWRDYGLCVFDHCSYEDHICKEGFDKWNDTSRDRTARFYENPPVPGRVSWVKGI